MKNIKSVRIRIAAAAAVVLAGIGVGVVVWNNNSQQQPNQAATTSTVVSENNSPTDHVTYQGVKGKTALAQLKELKGDVATKSSSYGEYVDAINGLTGGDAGKYWTFYVDGKMASVGAADYIAKGGETIEWKFENAQ